MSEFLYALSRLYFYDVHLLFAARNAFIPKTVVQASKNEILHWSAVETAKKIRQGEIKISAVLEAYISRIEEVNPQINALVSKNYENARKVAKEQESLLQRYAGNEQKLAQLAEEKPFFGVPFTTKDCYAVKGLPSTCGVTRLKNFYPDYTVPFAERAMNAGGILLGLSNVPEMALHYDTYNRLWGATRNPYDSRRSCAGSSGGEAALLATQATCISIGSDCGGSIRLPASFCGLFGLKTTANIISKSKTDETSSRHRPKMHCIGPMARQVCDLPFVLKVLVQPDILPSLNLDEPVDLSKTRVFHMDGISHWKTESLTKTMGAALHKALQHMKHVHGHRSLSLNLKQIHRSCDLWKGMFEFGRPGLERAETTLKDKEMNVFVEMLKFVLGKSDHSIISINHVFSEKYGYDEKKMAQLQKECAAFEEELGEILGSDGVLFFPSFPTQAPFLHEPDYMLYNVAYTAFVNAIGFPAIVIPMGLHDGLPTAVQVIAALKNERLLIALARDFEEAFGGYQPPPEQ